MISDRQMQILRYMQDGQWVSGPRLAKVLNISPSTVWKEIHSLKAKALSLENHPKKGYRLTEPLYLLDAQAILQKLDMDFLAENPQLYLLPSTPSTNTYCRQEIAAQSVWSICCSEEQTAGKGRLNRRWNSPFAQNLYCSLSWMYKGSPAELSGVSLVISLALQQALARFTGPILQIKWPNDLVSQGKKMAGILIETQSQSNGDTQIIIGFGININTDTISQPLSDYPHCSLRDITGRNHNRNPILASCLNHIFKALNRFVQDGLSSMKAEWESLDALRNQAVTVYQQNSSLQGIARGISEQGFLRLETPTGILEISTGDASLRSH